MACDISLENYQQGLKLCFRPDLNRQSTHKVMGPKVAGIPILGISGLPFGSHGIKCHLDVGFVDRHKVYYKGEGGGFPQIEAVVSLMSRNLPMARLNTKNVPTMH